jgi:hypothetical protein
MNNNYLTIDHPLMADVKNYLNQLLQEALLAVKDGQSTAKLSLSMELEEMEHGITLTGLQQTIAPVVCKGKVEARRVLENGQARINDLAVEYGADPIPRVITPEQTSFDEYMVHPDDNSEEDET